MATPKGITHEQRYHLCLKKQECPSMKQAELAAWFKSQYHTSISQPTISQSLKRSSEILSEGLFVPGVDTMRMRKRAVRHPELEMALFEWIKTQQERKTQRPRSQQYQRILRQISGSQDNDSLDRGRKKTGGGIGGAKTGRATRRKPLKRGVRAETESGLILELIDEVADEPITGPMMLREAKRIASEMNIDDMVFCPGWLSRFKSRYHIKCTSLRAPSSRQLRHLAAQRQHQAGHGQEQAEDLDQEERRDDQHQDFLESASEPLPDTLSLSGPASPSSVDSSGASGSLRMVDVLEKDGAMTEHMDIRPSIAVPASSNNSQTSLHHLLNGSQAPPHSENVIIEDAMMEAHALPTQIQQQQQQHRQKNQQYSGHHHQHQLANQRDSSTLPLSYQRHHPYQQPSPRLIQSARQCDPPASSTSASPSTSSLSTTTSGSGSRSVLHMEFLHPAVPIRANPATAYLGINASSAIQRPRHNSRHTSQAHYPSPNTMTELQETQEMVQRIRQFVGVHLADSTAALHGLDLLERALREVQHPPPLASVVTSTPEPPSQGPLAQIRESITIAEMQDEEDDEDEDEHQG